MTLRELEPRLAELSRAEKAQALQILMRDLGNVWPGVEKTPGVVGGDARTRQIAPETHENPRGGWW